MPARRQRVVHRGESCRSTAEFESKVFNLRMDLFRKLSQGKLH